MTKEWGEGKVRGMPPRFIACTNPSAQPRPFRKDLAKLLPSWDAPRMRLSTDDRCRLQSRELLKPNTPYEGQLDATGRVVLTELMPKAGPARFSSKEEVIRAHKSSRLKFRRRSGTIRNEA